MGRSHRLGRKRARFDLGRLRFRAGSDLKERRCQITGSRRTRPRPNAPPQEVFAKVKLILKPQLVPPRVDGAVLPVALLTQKQTVKIIPYKYHKL